MNSNSTHILWSLLLVAVATGVGAPEALADDDADSDDEQKEVDESNEMHRGASFVRNRIQVDIFHEIQFGETGADDEELKSALERPRNSWCLHSFTDEETFEGAFTVRLTVRDDIYDTGRFSGGITRVELLDSDFDEESETGECIISEFEESRIRFPPPQGEYAALIVDVTYEFVDVIRKRVRH